MHSQSKPIAQPTFETLVDSFETRISELEQRLTQQAAQDSAKIKELEHKLALVQNQLPESDTPVSPNLTTSRRKILKRFGWAAAGLAAASATALNPGAANTTRAASGDFLLLGNSNMASDTTYLSQVNNATPGQNAIAWFDWNSTGQSSALSNATAAIAATNSNTGNGVGGYFASANEGSPLWLQPGTQTSAPSVGSHNIGEIYVDANGSISMLSKSQFNLSVDSSQTNFWQKMISGVSMNSSPGQALNNTGITSTIKYVVLAGVASLPTRLFVGVYAYLTIINPSAAGTIKVFRGDFTTAPTYGAISFPSGSTSSYTYSIITKVGMIPSGQTGAGQLGIGLVSSTNVNVTLDITGYIG